MAQYTLPNLKSSSPLLAQTSHPPTRNLFGKTHDAGDGGANDDAIDDGIVNDADRLPKSMMKISNKLKTAAKVFDVFLKENKSSLELESSTCGNSICSNGKKRLVIPSRFVVRGYAHTKIGRAHV